MLSVADGECGWQSIVHYCILQKQITKKHWLQYFSPGTTACSRFLHNMPKSSNVLQARRKDNRITDLSALMLIWKQNPCFSPDMCAVWLCSTSIDPADAFTIIHKHDVTLFVRCSLLFYSMCVCFVSLTLWTLTLEAVFKQVPARKHRTAGRQTDNVMTAQTILNYLFVSPPL